MKYYTFAIVVEKEAEDDGYLQHLQSLLAHKQPIPQNEKLVHVEELTVAVP